ncbi:MAG TPA: Maf family protein [Caulobacteraceae bacterium]
MTVLASASPVRAQILRSAGVAFEIIPAQIDEEAFKGAFLAKGKGPEEVAGDLAVAKAQAVSRGRSDIVIGADQTLDLDGELVSKVNHLDEARECLLRLRGRSHRLHAGAALARDGEIRWRYVASVNLKMRAFSDSFLEAYLTRCGDSLPGSVGCYHFEGFGVQLFERVIGDYHAILGLPLIRLLAALRSEGVAPE